MSMMRMVTGVACFALVIVASASADLLTPTAQSRWIKASASIDSPKNPYTVSDEDEATGFEHFDSSVSASVGPASAGASQNSSIAGTGIDGSGGVGCSSDPIIYSAAGTSSLSVTFDLAQPLDFTLSGNLRPSGNDGSFGVPTPCHVKLEGPAGTVYALSKSLQNPDDPFGWWTYSASGQLAPGTYTLSASAHGLSYDTMGGGAGFSVDFDVVPEPATVMLLVALTVMRRR